MNLPVSNDPKPKSKSWTLWFNGAVVPVAVTVCTVALPLIPKEAAWATIAVAVCNFVLRFKTDKPVI